MNAKFLNAGQIIFTSVLVSLTIGGIGAVAYGGLRVYNRKKELKVLTGNNDTQNGSK